MDSGDIFLQVALLAFVLSQFTDALVKPLFRVINLFFTSLTVDARAAKEMQAEAIQNLINLWPLYVTTGIGLLVARYTELNLFPVFPSAAIGRLLTDIAIGLGPSFIHDLKPKATATSE